MCTVKTFILDKMNLHGCKGCYVDDIHIGSISLYRIGVLLDNDFLVLIFSIKEHSFIAKSGRSTRSDASASWVRNMRWGYCLSGERSRSFTILPTSPK